MKNKVSKALSLLLTLAMLMSFAPFALADGDPVAKIGETEYTSLADAFAAATDGDVIDILGDITVGELVDGTYGAVLNCEGTVTMHLHGHTITGDDLATHALFELTKGDLKIVPGEDRLGGELNSYNVANIRNDATIEIGATDVVRTAGSDAASDPDMIFVNGSLYSKNGLVTLHGVKFNWKSSQVSGDGKYWIYGSYLYSTRDRSVGSGRDGYWIALDSYINTSLRAANNWNLNGSTITGGFEELVAAPAANTYQRFYMTDDEQRTAFLAASPRDAAEGVTFADYFHAVGSTEVQSNICASITSGDTTTYGSLPDVFAAATNGAVIDILGDVTVGEWFDNSNGELCAAVLNCEGTVTMHLHGHTITGHNSGGHELFELTKGNLKIVPGSDGLGGELNCYDVADIRNGATIEIGATDVVRTADSDATSDPDMIFVNGSLNSYSGAVTLHGVKFNWKSIRVLGEGKFWIYGSYLYSTNNRSVGSGKNGYWIALDSYINASLENANNWNLNGSTITGGFGEYVMAPAANTYQEFYMTDAEQRAAFLAASPRGAAEGVTFADYFSIDGKRLYTMTASSTTGEIGSVSSLVASTSTGTVTLTKDTKLASDEDLIVYKVKTLDLDGKTLTVASGHYGAVFGTVKDTGNGAGLLNIAKDNMLFAKGDNGGYLPAYDTANTGYRFFTVDAKPVNAMNTVTGDSSREYKYYAFANTTGSEQTATGLGTKVADNKILFMFRPICADTTQAELLGSLLGTKSGSTYTAKDGSGVTVRVRVYLDDKLANTYEIDGGMVYKALTTNTFISLMLNNVKSLNGRTMRITTAVENDLVSIDLGCDYSFTYTNPTT